MDIGNVLESRLRSGAVQPIEIVEVNPRDALSEDGASESLTDEISNPAVDSRGALNVSDEIFKDVANRWTFWDNWNLSGSS